MDRIPSLSYSQIYDDKTAKNLEQEFSRLKGECYLDHAGATLHSDKQMREIFDDLITSLYSNPHSVGIASSITREIVERTRLRILEHFNASADEYSVIFTSGTTASLKLVAESFSYRSKNGALSREKGNFVYTQDNHTSVLGMRELASQKGAKVTCIKHEEAFELFHDHSSYGGTTRSQRSSNSLFVYPAQCNFSGLKYPLEWIEKAQNGILGRLVQDEPSEWFVCLDAASFAATNRLDLSRFQPDFVCISFYKMFGYPTGLGALLVKNSSAHVLEKSYYGGGAVNVVLSSKMYHVNREKLHERFEDGTISFLAIAALRHGFKALSGLGMAKISRHVFSLARYLHHNLVVLHHSNGQPLVQLYADTDYEDPEFQGGIVAFNVLRANGEVVGFMEALNMAAIHRIQFRTGCFCNPGACQRHLGLSDADILENYDSGFVCGGSKDLINGRPTGAIRVSFGYMSSFQDVDKLLSMIRSCYLNVPETIQMPLWWADFKHRVRRKYGNHMRRETRAMEEEWRNRENEIGVSLIRRSAIVPKTTDISLRNKSLSLKRLFIYPIKSCAAYEVNDSWILGSRGLQYDREWMITTSAGVCLTQKIQVKLCLIKPSICLKSKTLKLNYPGMPEMQIPLDIDSNDIEESTMCRSRVCGHRVEGIDCGSDVSEWISLALRQPNLRLIRQNTVKDRAKKKELPSLAFTSQAQYLLINEASIAWLADKVCKNSDCERSTLLHRFRGNIIVSGCKPFEETSWKRIRIGKDIYQVDGPCTRCQMVCIDQFTGKKTIEPLRTLAEEFHGKITFGIYLTRCDVKSGELSIGSLVECD